MAFLKNDADGNEFKVILWRTTQKNEATPQITTQKNTNTTQKVEFTTQKNDNATQKDIDATQKKVLDYFKQHPKGTRIEAAEAIGNITADGVKFIIGKLQQKGLLKRVGGRKLGEWQVLI